MKQRNEIMVAECQQRRNRLLDLIKLTFSNQGYVLLFADVENETHKFTQENNFYYFSGIEEAGTVLLISPDGHTTVYVPLYETNRALWVSNTIEVSKEGAYAIGVDSISTMGSAYKGYTLPLWAPITCYGNLIKDIEDIVGSGHALFTIGTQAPTRYINQHLLLQHVINGCSSKPSIHDIGGLVAQLRRKKSHREIEDLYKAIKITELAHEAAATAIVSGGTEAEVQAYIEYVMTASGATTAFPSIVAGGKYAAVLHYVNNNQTLNKGDLVVVDIGARYAYYCADLSRTYPVSGTFTDEQEKIYSIVYETQKLVESQAKPGMWINNKHEPTKSLHHIALSYLADAGYDTYFNHGIGHFLGLDVHDVGDISEPLAVGDVITIEPGIYIKDKKIGVRIEDNYWIVEDGVECLSADLPKKKEDFLSWIASLK